MTITVTPNESEIQAALRSFLLSVLPPGTPVIIGQANRTAEPPQPDFVVMTPILRPRLATNIDSYADAVFTGSIAGTTLDITAVDTGSLQVGQQIFGIDIAAGTVITALGSGTGGIGTYTVNNSQTFGPGVIAAGTQQSLQETMIHVQLDVHGPNSGDNAQVISTMFRDEYAVDQFAGQSPAYDITPLYSEDPKQVPFVNAESQWETRYIVEVMLQANQVVAGFPQQFAGSAAITLVDVDVVYPG